MRARFVWNALVFFPEIKILNHKYFHYNNITKSLKKQDWKLLPRSAIIISRYKMKEVNYG